MRFLNFFFQSAIVYGKNNSLSTDVLCSWEAVELGATTEQKLAFKALWDEIMKESFVVDKREFCKKIKEFNALSDISRINVTNFLAEVMIKSRHRRELFIVSGTEYPRLISTCDPKDLLNDIASGLSALLTKDLLEVAESEMPENTDLTDPTAHGICKRLSDIVHKRIR
jgi:hypothetical protein